MYYTVTENKYLSGDTKLRIFEGWEKALNYFSERADRALENNEDLRALRDKKGRTVGILNVGDLYYDECEIDESDLMRKVAREYKLCKTQYIQIDGCGEWFKVAYTVHVEEGMALYATPEYNAWEIHLKPAEEAQPIKHWQKPEHRPGLIDWMARQNMFEGFNIADAWNVAAAEYIDQFSQNLKP